MKLVKKIAGIYLKFSFRKKLLVALLIISCFMAAYIGLTSYRLSSRTIYDIGKKLSENNINVINGLLDDYFQSVQDNLTQVIRLPLIREVLERKSVSPGDQRQLTIQISNSMRQILYLGSENNDIDFKLINFYFRNGFSYTSMLDNQLPYNDYYSCMNYFTENRYITDESYTPTTWCEVMILKDNLEKENICLLGIRMLYDSVTLEKLGIIVFAINENDLYQLYSSFSPEAFIMHKNGKLISGADKVLLGKDLYDPALREKILQASKNTASIQYRIDNKVKLISFKRLASDNAYFVVPFDYYTGFRSEETKDFALYSFLNAIAGMGAAVFFAFLLSKGLSSSVLSLKRVVQKVYDGDLNARFISDNTDEVAYLGEKFNDALDEINTLFKIQEQDSHVKRNLELRLMQSQINPHLLYNTLDSVLWALKNENTPKAQKLIISLSSFFKITLSGGSVLIPLESELEMIFNYINIQRLARGKNITLDIRIPEELKKHRIIKLTLQPIIENSILHGFSGYRDDGMVTVDAQVSKDELQICVQDNGIGVLPEELSKLNSILNTYPPLPDQKHFGLYNVNRRIKNIFGDHYGIYLESEVGNFTRIIVRIPYLQEEQELGQCMM